MRGGRHESRRNGERLNKHLMGRREHPEGAGRDLSKGRGSTHPEDKSNQKLKTNTNTLKKKQEIIGQVVEHSS